MDNLCLVIRSCKIELRGKKDRNNLQKLQENPTTEQKKACSSDTAADCSTLDFILLVVNLKKKNSIEPWLMCSTCNVIFPLLSRDASPACDSGN